MGIPNKRLTDILGESEDSDGGDEGNVSLDQMIVNKLRGMDGEDIEVLMKKFSSHESFGDRLGSAMAAVRSVHAGDMVMTETADDAEELMAKRSKSNSGFHGRKWIELARFIPIRLTSDERRILSILDRTLKVSEYTDNVDIYVSRRDRLDTISKELGKIQSVLSGQFIAMKMSKTTDQLTESWFKDAFEVGRRYKAMNPDRMRETYVKLMYMLQDSRTTGDMCEWSQRSMRTVATVLTEDLMIDKSDFLSDPMLDEFVHGGGSKSVLNALIDKYISPPKSRESLELVVWSIQDYVLLINSFLDPLTELLGFLKKFFDPASGASSGLAIRSGENGSRLTHSHTRQYQYVSQSLRLWREVLMYFMPIWFKAEEDLLASNYRLADTGQGLNRVQSAPNCSKLMHQIVEKVQRDMQGSWIGSSVVHMGDHTVPNALMFLDKYCQISRILGPVAHTLRQLPKEYATAPEVVRGYIDETFGGVEMAQKSICADFFKHAFDGSGADNAYDAGSCIDGRLTSSWNWCSKIEKKPYFPLFLLTNFTGFDGQHGW